GGEVRPAARRPEGVPGGVSLTTARKLAWATAAAHVAAVALSALALRRGSVGAPLAERMTWIAERHPGWYAGWGAWAACAVTLVLLLASLAEHGKWARAAVSIGAGAAAIDLSCDAVWVGVLPACAASGIGFETVERIALVVGALAANLLYALAVLIATADLPVRRLGWIAAGMTGGALLLAVGGWRASETL